MMTYIGISAVEESIVDFEGVGGIADGIIGPPLRAAVIAGHLACPMSIWPTSLVAQLCKQKQGRGY